jgi:catecholate siderophore receptor
MGGELTNGWSLVADNSGDGSAVARSDQRASPSWRALKSALLLGAASCIAYPASAQQAPEAVPLPPLNVEATAKKKVAAKKGAAKKSAPTQAVSPTPQPAPTQATTQQADPAANPYANPNAPYQVQQSGAGQLTEPLLNTPKTVTAIPQEVIEDKGATTLRELARQTPGVTIHAGEGGASFGTNFEIRGYNARNDIFVDGIRDPGNIGRDIFALQQLEIYKGPSGVLSGRGTPGGAFNFITKEPVLNYNFYEVETTVGTDETFRTTLDANQVVTRDFALRANIMYNQNEVAGRDFTEDERWGGLLSAKARPSDDLSITLDYYRYRADGLPDWGVPVSPAARVPFTELGVDRDNWYGQLSLDYIKDESDVGTATVVANLSDSVTLTNKTRIGSNLSDYIATAARPDPATQSNINGLTNTTNPQRVQDTTLYANQTELEAKFVTGSWKHTVVAGLDLSREEMSRYANTIVPPGAVTTSIRNPNPYRGPRQKTGKSLVFDATIDNVGVYIGDTIHLTEQWIVNGGVRLDNFKRDQVGGPNNAATAAAAATNIFNNTAEVEENLVSWHAGIVYKPIPIASIYAAIATSETPIGNELDSTSGEYNGLTRFNAALDPEKATGIELGTKWELFDRRLLATAAIFQTDKYDARTNRGVNAAATPLAIGNQGEYRVRGIELGVAGNVTDAWSLFGGVVLLNTEVLDSDLPAEIGRRMANTPLTQFALLTKYQLTDQLAVGGQAIYQSEFYAGHYAQNDTFYHSVPYWRFDALVEYEINKHWEVLVQGLNLTDEVYYDAIYQGGNSFAYVAPGRAGYLTVKWKY